MKFTSEIVRTANKLKGLGMSRSRATQIAFLRTKSELAAFSAILAEGFAVNFQFFAEKHQSDIIRKGASIAAAIEAGLYQPVGGERRGTHLFVYYDLSVDGVRNFKRVNFKQIIL